jgi:hypothetical protein
VVRRVVPGAEDRVRSLECNYDEWMRRSAESRGEVLPRPEAPQATPMSRSSSYADIEENAEPELEPVHTQLTTTSACEQPAQPNVLERAIKAFTRSRVGSF